MRIQKLLIAAFMALVATSSLAYASNDGGTDTQASEHTVVEEVGGHAENSHADAATKHEPPQTTSAHAPATAHAEASSTDKAAIAAVIAKLDSGNAVANFEKAVSSEGVGNMGLWLLGALVVITAIGLTFFHARVNDQDGGKHLRWSVGAKLICGFSVVLVILTWMSIYSLSSIGGIGKEISSLADDIIPLSNTVSRIEVLQLEQSIALERAFRFGEEEGAHARQMLDKSVAHFEEKAHELDKELADSLKWLEELPAHSTETAESMAEAMNTLAKIEAEHHGFEAAAEKAIELIHQNKHARARLLEEHVEKMGDEVGHELGTLLVSLEERTEEAAQLAESHESRAALILTIAAVVASLIGFFVAIFNTRLITKPVGMVADTLKVVADGDYSQKVDIDSKDEIGQMAGSLNVAIDATRKAVETAQQSVDNLNSLPTLVMAIDKEYNVTYMNPAGAGVLGSTPEQVVGKKCYSLFKTPHCQTAECRCSQAMQRGETSTGETVADPDGLNLPIRYTGTPIKDADGRIVGALEFVVDMSETKKAMDEAQQSVDNLNNLPTPVMAIDKEYNVTYMNPTGASVVGSTPEQVIGQKCYSLFKTPHCQTAECRCAQAMQKDQSCTGETVADPSGLNMPIAYTGSPIKDGDGNIVGALEFVVDQTEIKKAQAVAKNVAAYQEKEVEKLSATLSKVADGDLRVNYAVADADDDTQGVAQSFDGIAGALNSTVRSLSEVIGQVTESAAQFNEGSRVIAESSQTLASGAQTQSASVEEVSASVEELTASIDGVKTNASEADVVAKKTNQLAEQGGQAVAKSTEAMELIRTSSDQIAEIIQVISEIASQTNLLALNAAIEAARAGEHGMGFAVVADEVRKLAERSNQAAGEITSLIKESSNRVQEGAQLSDETGSALKEIVGGVQETVSKISEIATATIEQATNAQQVSEAIQGIAQVTEQSAAGSEEMASSSEELGAQASALRDLVSRFKTDDSQIGHQETATV